MTTGSILGSFARLRMTEESVLQGCRHRQLRFRDVSYPTMKLPRPPLLLSALAALAVPTAFGLEWKEQHLTIEAQPLQRSAETSFAFTNRSDRPVQITSVDTSCDCTEATP